MTEYQKGHKQTNRNKVKGLNCMCCPECGMPMALSMSKCIANDCNYSEDE